MSTVSRELVRSPYFCNAISSAFSISVFCLDQYRFGIARFLLVLYIAVLVNGVVFRHAHRLADGTIICHAHPYRSSPGTQFPTHAHNRDELIWLDAFANALYANPGSIIWIALVAVVLLLSVGDASPVLSSFVAAHVAFRHRGPPVHLVDSGIFRVPNVPTPSPKI